MLLLTKGVVDRWSENIRSEMTDRRRRLAEIRTNIELLNEARQSVEAELHRLEGILAHAGKVAEDVESALYESKTVDSLAVTRQNGDPIPVTRTRPILEDPQWRTDPITPSTSHDAT